MHCPLCGSTNVYIGMNRIECDRRSCENYDGKSGPPPPIMACLVELTTGETEMRWAAEELKTGDPLTPEYNGYHGDSTVRKALQWDIVIGRCVRFDRFRTEGEALEAFCS